MHLYTAGGNINTTTNHPFYVIRKGWVAAGDLAEGDEVYNLGGTISTVLGFEIEVLDEPVLVYNLEVDGFNSYFVGDGCVLVHNYTAENGAEKGTITIEDQGIHKVRIKNKSSSTISISGTYSTGFSYMFRNPNMATKLSQGYSSSHYGVDIVANTPGAIYIQLSNLFSRKWNCITEYANVYSLVLSFEITREEAEKAFSKYLKSTNDLIAISQNDLEEPI